MNIFVDGLDWVVFQCFNWMVEIVMIDVICIYLIFFGFVICLFGVWYCQYVCNIYVMVCIVDEIVDGVVVEVGFDVGVQFVVFELYIVEIY